MTAPMKPVMEPRKYTLPDGTVVTDEDFEKGDIVPWLLTDEEDAQRRKFLRRATGRGSWWEYPFFRGFILLIGSLLVKRVFVDKQKVPGGLKQYPRFYLRGTKAPIDNRGQRPIIVAPTHADERDILITGSFRRPLVWTCKPWFVSGPRWLANWCLINGAFPMFRPQLDGRYHPKHNRLDKIHRLQMRSYKPEEALIEVERRINQGFSAEFFIEGTRKGSSTVEGGFLGAIRVSRRTGVPLLPIAIVGVSQDDPIIRPGFLPWRRVVLAVVCDPISPRDFEHLPTEEAERAMRDAWIRAVNAGRDEGRVQIRYDGRNVGTVEKETKE